MKAKEVNAKRVFAVNYKCTSYYGNPSYWVSFETEGGEYLTGYTASNAACGYGCTNFIGKGCRIKYHTTRAGRVVIDYMSK